MASLVSATDPRIEVALLLVELGLSSTEKIKAAWQARGMDDAVLDDILTEVQARLDRRRGQ